MKIVAQFSIDPEDGQPARKEAGGVNHYSIALKLQGAPNSIHRVRYHLHETYFEPVRNVSARTPEFEEPLTSYGDFEVTAEIQEGTERHVLKRQLSEALADGHRAEMTESIQRAIQDIKRK